MKNKHDNAKKTTQKITNIIVLIFIYHLSIKKLQQFKKNCCSRTIIVAFYFRLLALCPDVSICLPCLRYHRRSKLSSRFRHFCMLCCIFRILRLFANHVSDKTFSISSGFATFKITTGPSSVGSVYIYSMFEKVFYFHI